MDVRGGAVILAELSTGTILRGMVTDLTSSTLKLKSVGCLIKKEGSKGVPVCAENEIHNIRRSSIVRWRYLREGDLTPSPYGWKTSDLPQADDNGFWLGSGEPFITADT